MSKAKDSPAKTERPPGGAPHSWELDTWPADVWPHVNERARWIARAYRKELIAAGAITRVGKTLVFIGARYTRWFERRAPHVVEFVGNNPAIRSAPAPPPFVPRSAPTKTLPIDKRHSRAPTKKPKRETRRDDANSPSSAVTAHG